MNYDEQVLGTGNINHPANQTELTDREMLTEVYNVSKEVLEIFDTSQDCIKTYQTLYFKSTRDFVHMKVFLNEIKETLSASDNGICIIVRNQIENFLNK